MQSNVVDKLVLEGRKLLTMTNVISVDGFSEQYLKITVPDSKALISGEGLKVVSFSKENGDLCVEGKINEIKYLVKKQPIIKRLFK